MGYYSEVAVALRKKDYDAIFAEARATESLTPGNFELLRCASLRNKKTNQEAMFAISYSTTSNNYRWKDGDILVLHWNWIKWYSASVNWFMDQLHKLDEYDFVRIGESPGDCEEDLNFEDPQVEICYSINIT